MSDLIDMSRLFADYVSGEISAEKLYLLQTALRNNTELRQEFIEYLNIDSALGDLAALSRAEVAEIEAAEHEGTSGNEVASESVPISPSVVRGNRVIVILGTIAAILLLTTILWFTNRDAIPDSYPATLVSRVEAELMHDGHSFSGSQLGTGEYLLDRGLLHLQFGGEVMVYVEAPARFNIVSDERLLLHYGRVSANVPPQGVGFTVETPEAEIIDFGTEFSVDVEPGTSEVHVFEGLVRVQPKTEKDGQSAEAVDLRKSQAVKIEGVTEKPIEIELAMDRFIRTFEEPKLKYPRAVKRLSPLAYYRMPIRDQGLASDPPEYAGIVLTGDGTRSPHARGVSNGGSLRVLDGSTGRGGRVETPPPLITGQFTMAVFVNLENPAPNGTLATNIQNDRGNFALSLDESGRLHATIRTSEGELVSVSADSPFPIQTWRHLIMTADGEHLRIYDNEQLVASSPCTPMADCESDSLWFGTDATGLRLWNGRIDELTLFDRALTAEEINDLHSAVLEEMAVTK